MENSFLQIAKPEHYQGWVVCLVITVKMSKVVPSTDGQTDHSKNVLTMGPQGAQGSPSREWTT